MDIDVKLNEFNTSREVLAEYKAAAGEALDRLWSGKEPLTGWVQAPLYQDKAELDYLLNVADIVKQEAELMVVIGIGGSYMGAKAAVEALPKMEDGIEIKFAGTNLCTAYHSRLMDEMSRRQTVLCVVSKSGETVEVVAAYEILRALMEKKYGSREAASRRIITITGSGDGYLQQETRREGYINMTIPEDICGRFSVMTPAGLFPMAVAGIDVRSLLEGAKTMAVSPDWDKDGTDYAIARYLLQQDRQIETIELYDTRLVYLGEWLKQLYGESEGKDGRGFFPAVLDFTTDLHSAGQILQDGNQIFFETVIVVDQYEEELEIPAGPLKGFTLESLNKMVMECTVKAHEENRTPIIEIHIPKLDAYYYGQLLYFLQTTCAITAMLMGVDPFDQPGVEKYKAELKEKLAAR